MIGRRRIAGKEPIDSLKPKNVQGYFGNREQKYRCVAKLGNFSSLPQCTPALDGAVIGKKHLMVQGILPSNEQRKSNHLLI